MGDGMGGWEVWRIRKELETEHPDDSLERQDGTKVDSLPPCRQPIHTFSRSRYLPCHVAARLVGGGVGELGCELRTESGATATTGSRTTASSTSVIRQGITWSGDRRKNVTRTVGRQSLDVAPTSQDPRHGQPGFEIVRLRPASGPRQASRRPGRRVCRWGKAMPRWANA